MNKNYEERIAANNNREDEIIRIIDEELRIIDEKINEIRELAHGFEMVGMDNASSRLYKIIIRLSNATKRINNCRGEMSSLRLSTTELNTKNMINDILNKMFVGEN